MIPPRLFALLEPIVNPLQLVDADDNGSKPSKPFWELRVRGRRTLTRAKSEPDADGIVTHTATTVYDLEMTCHGLDAFTRATAAEMALHFSSTTDRACLLNLGIGQINNVMQVPILLNRSQYEEAGMIDFAVYERAEARDDEGLIEHAVITGQFDPDGGAPLQRIVASSPDAVMPPPETEG